MLTIKRDIQNKLIKYLKPNKVLVLLGARRTGKTIILKQLIETITERYILLNGEDDSVQEALKRRSIQHYKNFLGDIKLLLIDEAQNIPNIGNILKLMIDEIEDLKIVVTGSSAFDISNQTGEPLTGRKYTFYIYPFSEKELNAVENIFQKTDNLKQRLIFGNYPELLNINNNNEKTMYLQEILNSYLLKDILIYENLRNSTQLLKLLKLLAYQVGSQVSLQEIGQQLSMSKNTVEKYLDVLSKVFIIYKLPGFSRNLRKEISKSNKWYFYDNGIRNIIIGDLRTIEQRNDVGILWENYILSERLKYNSENEMFKQNYFWRTYDQQEIDFIEEYNGELSAYEIKWRKKNVKIPKAWEKAYPESTFKVITPENYLDWIGV